MPQNSITCKLTGKAGKPIKAHIIPKALYDLGGKMGRVIKGDGNGGAEIKKMPVGFYDQTILIDDGERYFSKCDDYAAKFLGNKGGYNEGTEGVAVPGKDGTIVCLVLDGVDQNLLRFFFLSVLWRASVSSQDFFSTVNLGLHEKLLRKRMLERHPGSPHDHLVIVFRYQDTPKEGFPIERPRIVTHSGLNFMRLYFPMVYVDIKVTRKRAPRYLKDMALGSYASMHVWCHGNFKETKNYREVARIVRQKFPNGPLG